MEESLEIKNKVAESGLVSIDLEAFYPAGTQEAFDLSDWLFEGLILREKDFRERAKNHNWTDYAGKHVAVTCTTDAIVPLWAFMLISSYLQPYAATVVFGNEEALVAKLYRQWMDTHDFAQYQDKRLIIKGCSKKQVPTDTFMAFVAMAQPYARSIMYGEPCSTVPIYKNK